MSQLHLIRSKMACEWGTYYEEKTDVWLFGDLAGYASLQATLAEAMKSRHPVLLPHKRKSNSMRLCILPAASRPTRAPRLKLVERIVFLAVRPRWNW